jgi:PAT family beta-lactamase induction signal transducer AmpG
MRLPNLLSSRRGRLAAFFLLYVTEGIPFGFAALAIATQMRRSGLSTAIVGAFVGAIYLPWGFKWLIGPVVDVVASDRFGRRRLWILCMQALMVATLMLLLTVNAATQVGALVALIILHNCFAATQDVAIDALACNTLHPDERGVANGLMFGGSYLGQALGGSGALMLAPYIGFNRTYFFVGAMVLLVTVTVVLPMREPALRDAVPKVGSAVARIGAELRIFVRDSWRAFTARRAAWLGLVFTALPVGAMALGLSLLTNLAVELGMDDAAVGRLTLWVSILTAAGCMGGGWLSDRLGRRRMMAAYVLLMAVPTLWLAWSAQQHGWITPAVRGQSHIEAPMALITVFWIAALSYSIFQGSMYATRGALCMDLTDPRVAATQFAAYMAMSNLVNSYSSAWQGVVVQRLGYPRTLLLDALLGMLCLLVLPALTPRRIPA